MRKVFILLLATLILFNLVGCVDKDKQNTNKNKQPEAIICEDADKLVKLSLVDGAATIAFDLERWNKLHHIYDYDPDFFSPEKLREGPFPIIVESGKIKEAYIAKLASLDYGLYDFDMPIVVMLMDDNSIEWLPANPFDSTDLSYLGGEYENYDNFRSSGKLAYRDNFTSLVYAADNEGLGNMTLYAVNELGHMYDFYYLWLETRLCDGSWISEIVPAQSEDDFSIQGRLTMSPEGQVTFDLGIIEGIDYEIKELYESWQGEAQLITSTDQLYPLGSLLLDLTLDKSPLYELPTDKIKASYRADIGPDGDLSLFYNNGTALYQNDENIQQFLFWQFWEDMYALN